MFIGDLAKKTGISIDTIRYYEKAGLIFPVSVCKSGYREFDDTAAETLRFITRAKQLGFSLREIRDLLALKKTPETTCKQVKARAEQKRAEIIHKIQSLQEMKKELDALVHACRGDESGLEACSIVKTLEGKEQ
ncbi:MerR family DNA-binding protein [Luteithermobacter gelatinilyticus]|uniref:MerR family DNA-binding protein n=1 Tax=Luteithermobacter gelatinilyticus TaxID=2582913 RepID=UPI001105E436|nr:MerR family DNA-binding protein [Luteithermobacter gelatinilyticus]